MGGDALRLVDYICIGTVVVCVVAFVADGLWYWRDK